MSGIGDDHTDHPRGAPGRGAAPPQVHRLRRRRRHPRRRGRPRLAGPAYAAVPSAAADPRALRPRGPPDRRRRPDLALITITINQDGTASFALPRMEVGQGITTSTAMIIAEELDLPVEKVHVTLAPARPELVLNQLTGGSNTTVSTYTPIRVAAADRQRRPARGRRHRARVAVDLLTRKEGVITAPDGLRDVRRARDQAASADDAGSRSSSRPRRLHGRSARRATASTRWAPSPGASSSPWTSTCPARCRRWSAAPPTLNGSPRSLRNEAAVLAMPGVTHVALVDTGVAVRAETFGQCIDAIRALTSTGTPARSRASPTRRSWPGCARPSSRSPSRTSRCWPRRSS